MNNTSLQITEKKRRSPLILEKLLDNGYLRKSQKISAATYNCQV